VFESVEAGVEAVAFQQPENGHNVLFFQHLVGYESVENHFGD